MAARTCYRHSSRATGASCTRCGRPICPDCMIVAPVGHHCPTCVQEASGGRAGVKRVRFAPVGTGARVGVKPGPVVVLLLLANVAVFVADAADPELALRLADNALLVAVRDEYYRMFTAAFLHANVFHLAFNMLGLYVMGSQLEEAYGPARFGAVYVLAAVGGSACSHFFGPPLQFGVGASGAVFGIFGAFYVVARARGLDASQIGGLIVVNLLFGLVVPQIDNAAHVGGLITGAALAAAFEWAGRHRAQVAAALQGAAVVAVGAVIVVATLVRVEQLRNTVGL